MNETAERRPKRWLLILAGWIVALGCSAILIAIRAPRVHAIDPTMPFLITPVWVVSFALVSVGTFRLTRFMKNMVARAVVTMVAVSVQCFAYYLALLVPAIYIHLWAGGNL
ncbi:MAG: hypothetical protein E4H02_08845 [Lentisphaerales bacterium]|nr:MAG: hypothetical protein E4H02_08845 [Lentisphaerales bacterium]